MPTDASLIEIVAPADRMTAPSICSPLSRVKPSALAPPAQAAVFGKRVLNYLKG
jgi:hypothetical protein